MWSAPPTITDSRLAPPDGRLDPGENPDEGTGRQLREETGIDPLIGSGVWIRRPTRRMAVARSVRMALVARADDDRVRPRAQDGDVIGHTAVQPAGESDVLWERGG